jgi:hypothetical protein
MTTTAPAGFVALPVQERLFNTVRDGKHRIVGFGGGIRGTKTWGSLALLVTLCRIFPRSRWAVVRKDLPTLKRNTFPSFEKLRELFGGFVGPINQSDWTSTCRNGSKIIWFPESLQEDPDLSRWKGLEVNGFLMEEADELAERSYYKALERAGAWIVPNGTQPPPYVICTFNPCANWPKRVFYEPWKNGAIAAPYAFVPATQADNPYVADEQREAWRSLPEQEYKRFVEGDWDVLTGRYYGELDARVHVKGREALPDPIPLWWEMWGSYDWGYAHWATFGLWVKDANGTPHLVDTLWLRRHQDPAQAREIVRFVEDHKMSPALNQVYAGRDAFNKVTAHGASGESTADVFLKYGIRLERADDDKVNGGRAVRRALHITTEPDGSQSAGVYLLRTAGNLRVYDQLAEVMPDENDVNKPAKMDCDAEGRGGDDGADMFRNGLSTQIPEAVEPLPLYQYSNVTDGKAEPAPWEVLEQRFRMPDEEGRIDRRVYENRRSAIDSADSQFGGIDGW